MKSERHNTDIKIYEKKFEFSIFFFSFLIFALLFTFQMYILGPYINYQNIPLFFGIADIVYWLVMALIFTFGTLYQVRRRYRKPIELFAEASKKVANGDFSVSLQPKHEFEKSDYMDAIFINFNKMVEELRSIETLKTDFISNVSHEIKTPLAIIQNYSILLQSEKLSPNQRTEYAAIITAATKRLSSLVTNILKLNKLEKQTIPVTLETFDLNRHLSECALLFEEQWEKKDIEFIADIEDRIIINTDASLLEIIWNNLIANAVKFTPNRGTITLKQYISNERVYVSISDTGCGMSKETLRHIFDKFYQGDSSHSTEGNGLGLALVKRISEIINASISVYSEPEKGTVFTVSLPIVKTEK